MTHLQPRSPSAWRLLLSWRSAIAWLVLASTLLVQLLFLWHLRNEEARAANLQFELLADKVTEAISKRLLGHEQILLGGAGLFNAVGEVSRAQWHTYVERLQLEYRYPGIQGVGFSRAIRPEERGEHIAAIRAEGHPDYSIYPPGERALYTPIIYLEPLDARNQTAFGYDMYAEPVRRQAMQRAAEQGQTSITRKVTLVQEIEGKVQAGLLMYVPVYRPNMPLHTPLQRLQALYGFVFSPYRVDDLMQGILGAADLKLDLTIYASEHEAPLQQIFSTRTARDEAREPMISLLRQLHHHGQTWTLRLNSLPEFEAGFHIHDELNIILATGLSLVLFFLTFSLISRESRARALALEMTEDIRQSRQALRQSEERLTLAMKGSNDGLWDMNLDTGTFYASARAWQILGYPAGEASTELNQWERLVDPRELPPAREQLAALLRSARNHFTVELLMRHRDGHDVPALLRGYIQRDSDGRALRLSGTIMDLTERRRIERMKSEFISTVSHELRTPLTSICGSLGLITGGAVGEIPDGLRPLLEIAHQNSLRLSHLINDLLDMEKMNAGKVRLRLQEAALLPLLEDALTSSRGFAAQQGVQCRLIEPPPADLRVRVDPLRLQQVLSNLITNAIKYSPPAGEVGLTCQQREARVQVCIHDQGPGIPEAFRDRVFTRFAQADSSDSRRQGGTGLGLAISKELVERMGGRIGFESIAGQGTTFWFELPVQRPASDAHGDTRPRVLVVEDEPDTGRRLHVTLGRAGYAVDRVQSLRLARERLADGAYRAMTLELHLPDGHGAPFIRQLRESPATRELPILVISAAARLEVLADGPLLAWLQKPVSDAQLLATLERLVSYSS